MLREQVVELVREARQVLADSPASSALSGIAQRLDEPLRVAVVGRVKAGKSTLLNALIGERLAATDHGECTRIVTWYRDGFSHSVHADLVGGGSVQLAAPRRGDRLEIDLGGRAASDVQRLVVTRPSTVLGRMTLIDTPGLGSTTDALGARTFQEFAGPRDDSPADAVIYLLRHLHEDDVGFLEAFHGSLGDRVDPANSIGVLSRSDEIGGADDRFMKEAAAVAARMANDPRLRTLVQTVVPVAGLVAETAASLTEEEYRRLAVVSKLPAAELESLCLTVDRFLNRNPELGLSLTERQELLTRFGLFGLRTAAAAIAKRAAPNSEKLKWVLMRASRLDDLSDLIGRVFESRGEILQSRSALLTLRSTLADAGLADHRLADRCEALLEAPEFREIDLLTAVRHLQTERATEELDLLARLLGGDGCRPWQRLGLAADAGRPEIQAAGGEVLTRLKRRQHDPRVRGPLRAVLDGAVVACEAVLTRGGPP